MAVKVLVVGASSGVGLQTVRTMLAEGEKFEIYALVRDQDRAFKAIGLGAERVRFVRGDVTKPETLPAACRGMAVVVCAVGARDGWKLPCFNGQTPKFVDYLGVQSLAGAAVAEKVPKFVLVTSIGVTRPFWWVSIFLNVAFGNVIHWKLKAEESVRLIFSQAQNLSYYIVRPGGLNNDDGGKKGIILSQGDRAAGQVSRADVARVLIGCVDGKCPPNVTFEVINSKDPHDLPPDHIEDMFQMIVPDIST